MQNKFHGDQLKEKAKYRTELGFWGPLGITPCSETVTPHNNQNFAVALMLSGHYFPLGKLSHFFLIFLNYYKYIKHAAPKTCKQLLEGKVIEKDPRM